MLSRITWEYFFPEAQFVKMIKMRSHFHTDWHLTFDNIYLFYTWGTNFILFYNSVLNYESNHYLLKNLYQYSPRSHSRKARSSANCQIMWRNSWGWKSIWKHKPQANIWVSSQRKFYGFENCCIAVSSCL